MVVWFVGVMCVYKEQAMVRIEKHETGSEPRRLTSLVTYVRTPVHPPGFLRLWHEFGDAGPWAADGADRASQRGR